MTASPHGQFELYWSGSILVQRVAGVFNEEGAVAWFKEQRTTWLDRGSPERFGLLNDLRAWEGATEGAFRVFATQISWHHAHGVIAAANVHDGNFMRQLAAYGLGTVLLTVPAQNFSGVAEAWAWLESLGIDCGDPQERERR